VANINFNSDAFMKGMTWGTPSSLVQDGPGFHPWKTVLGHVTPSTGKTMPKGVTVAKAFA
jgi:hypothetical protein